MNNERQNAIPFVVNGWTRFTIRFQPSKDRSSEETWDRFAPDLNAARLDAERVLDTEFLGEALLVSVTPAYHLHPYPHPGRCEGCHAERRCNVCGCDINASSHCRNGRCLDCHLACCTPIDDAANGHGLGKSQLAEYQAAARARFRS